MKSRPMPPYAAVDVAAVVVLTVCSMAGLWDSLSGTRWIVLGGAGLGLGLLWTLLLLSMRAGMDLVMGTLPVLYLLTAGGIALGSEGFGFGIPDGRTLGDVMSGTFTGWLGIVGTAPPLDASGVVLLIPYALCLVVSGSAVAIALRSRRPLAPVLPMLLMYAVILLLGMHDPFSILGQGLAFAIVAVVWVAHRGGRLEAGRDETTADAASANAASAVPPGRVVAMVAIVLVAAALVTPFVDTHDRSGRWLLRETVTPFDSEVITTPLTEFRRFRLGATTSLAGETLFTVKGVPVGTRVRLAVLDNYDGERWYADSDRSPDDYEDRFLRISSHIDNPGPGIPRVATIEVRRTWEFDWLPTVGRVQSFEFYDDGDHYRRDAVRYNVSTGTAILQGGLFRGETYVLDTLVAPDALKPSMKAWPARDEELWRAAAFLDAPASVWSLGSRSPMQAVFEVARRLKHRGRYSDGGSGWYAQFTAGQSEERLGAGFVHGERQVGDDEQYAAAMALLANRLGVPARVVVGAIVPKSGKVKGQRVGAWVEVRVANGSWRTLPNAMFMSRKPPRRVDEPLRDITQPPSQGQQQEQAKDRKPDVPEQRAQEPEQVVGQGRGAPWWLLLLLVPGAVLLIPFLKAVRNARRRSHGDVALRYAGAWAELVDTARDLGVTVAPAIRPVQAALLEVDVTLAREADTATFAEASPSTEDADDFWERLEDVRFEMTHARPAWRRLLAKVNPASLMPRRRRVGHLDPAGRQHRR